MRNRVQVVDDDPAVARLLEDVLVSAGHTVRVAGSAAALQAQFPEWQPDVVLLDWHLPDADGLELMPLIKRQWPETEIVLMTGFGTFDAAVEAIKRGAFHFQSKPIDPQGLVLLVQRACEHRQLNEQAVVLRRAVSTLSGGATPIFKSAVMQTILRTVERVAPSDVSLLITGESGTGKEVILDLLHALSPRARRPLVKVNCAALPRELIESELFGAVKGAYTGAHTDREGLFRQAEGGTLFLDEISEMPVDTQTKLLRVLQEKIIRPVGGRNAYKADCRIIAATNRRVEDAFREHKLREDLYYRIGAVRIDVPPLRDRRDDIVPMAKAFLRRFAAQAARGIDGFTPAALERLRAFDWPGNVRQLENEVQRAVLISEGTTVDTNDLSIADAQPAQSPEMTLSALETVERNTIVQVLKETAGNKLAAAKRLGIGRQTLYNKIQRYQINPTQ